MRVVVLASGSKGNVTYIETDNHKILFDLGMNLKYITEALAEINVSPREIDYIFISHVHKDHIGALETFIRRYTPTVCMSTSMFAEIDCIKAYEHIIIYEDEIVLSDVFIECIKTSHDVTDSRAFIITAKETSVVYLTDTGYLKEKHFSKLLNKNIYLFESNHDIARLMRGPYPPWLKARVLGDYGHLSNKDSSFYLSKLIGDKTKKIVLMHLSEENNTEELALETINQTFKDRNIDFPAIYCARQREILEVI